MCYVNGLYVVNIRLDATVFAAQFSRNLLQKICAERKRAVFFFKDILGAQTVFRCSQRYKSFSQRNV